MFIEKYNAFQKILQFILFFYTLLVLYVIKLIAVITSIRLKNIRTHQLYI